MATPTINQLKGIVKTIAASAEPISATALTVKIMAISAPTANTADAYVGDSTVAAGSVGFCVPKGALVDIQDMSSALNDKGEIVDLNKLYVAGTTNDKVTVLYVDKVEV
jgi:hypothetical protein